MSTLSKAAILAAKLKTSTVDCPEWGGCVSVRELNAGERARFEEYIAAKTKAGQSLDDVRERLVVLACVDDDGAPLFTDEDIPGLRNLSGEVVARVADEVLAISGMTDREDESAAGK